MKRVNFELIGFLGKNVEITTMENSDRSVLSGSLSIKGGYMDKKANTWVEKTEWYDFEYWTTGEPKVASLLQKGALVRLSGTPKAEGWLKDDKVNTKIKMVVDGIDILSTAKKDVEVPTPEQEV